MRSTYCRHKRVVLLDVRGDDPSDPIMVEALRVYPDLSWVEARWSEWGEWEADRTGGGPDDWAPGSSERRGAEVDWVTIHYLDGSESTLDLGTLAARCPQLAARAEGVTHA